MESKKELRKFMASLKARQAASALQQWSAEVLATLEAHPAFREARTVFLYHSLKDEVDTHAFIDKWCAAKRIVLPVVKGDDLELRLYCGSQEMKPGAYGIEEPAGACFTDYASIDLAVVPGVAFDRTGRRLGRGKGYYDRTLPHLTNARKIGICFPFQLIEAVPAEEFDIRMDEVIVGFGAEMQQ